MYDFHESMVRNSVELFVWGNEEPLICDDYKWYMRADFVQTLELIWYDIELSDCIPD